MADKQDLVEQLVDGLPTIRSQRRLLEVMSLACSAYYWFHIRVNHESNFVSVPVHIGSTRYLIPALWIGLLWAAWRYGQQMIRMATGLWKAITEDYRVELSRVARRHVRRSLRAASPEERERAGHAGKTPHFRGRALIQRFNFEKARRFDTNQKEVAPELPDGPLGRDSHSVIYVTIDWLDAQDAGFQTDVGYGISGGRAAWLQVRALLAAVTRRPAVLDCVTPGLLFLFGAYSLTLATLDRPLAPVCV